MGKWWWRRWRRRWWWVECYSTSGLSSNQGGREERRGRGGEESRGREEDSAVEPGPLTREGGRRTLLWSSSSPSGRAPVAAGRRMPKAISGQSVPLHYGGVTTLGCACMTNDTRFTPLQGIKTLWQEQISSRPPGQQQSSRASTGRANSNDGSEFSCSRCGETQHRGICCISRFHGRDDGNIIDIKPIFPRYEPRFTPS